MMAVSCKVSGILVPEYNSIADSGWMSLTCQGSGVMNWLVKMLVDKLSIAANRLAVVAARLSMAWKTRDICSSEPVDCGFIAVAYWHGVMFGVQWVGVGVYWGNGDPRIVIASLSLPLSESHWCCLQCHQWISRFGARLLAKYTFVIIVIIINGTSAVSSVDFIIGCGSRGFKVLAVDWQRGSNIVGVLFESWGETMFLCGLSYGVAFCNHQSGTFCNFHLTM